MSDLISFTYSTPEGDGPYGLDLSGGPDHTSRETRGVWVYGNRAWKIFPNMKQWNRVHNVYTTARTRGLPTPSFELYRGTVTDSRNLSKKGFALAATYITDPARFFALKDSTGTLKQLIASITNDNVLMKIEEAFSVAINMGLKDPQGFINQYDPEQPIMFIDLHTSNPAAMALEDMHNYVGTRRAALQQRQ